MRNQEKGIRQRWNKYTYNPVRIPSQRSELYALYDTGTPNNDVPTVEWMQCHAGSYGGDTPSNGVKEAHWSLQADRIVNRIILFGLWLVTFPRPSFYLPGYVAVASCRRPARLSDELYRAYSFHPGHLLAAIVCCWSITL